MPIEMNATVIVLSVGTRELLKKMHFPEIPEEAKYVVFTEEGDAEFFSELTFNNGLFPKPALHTMIRHYDNVDIEITS